MAERRDPARDTAYRLLRAVEDGAYANLELPRLVRAARLERRDAAFATELAYGTLRMRGFYDAVIGVAAARDVASIDAPALDVLRLGAHQLLAMRVPDHAAVAATVALARSHLSQGGRGFVNAVLRRVSEWDRAAWVDQVTAGLTDPVQRLAVEHSHPAWVVRALRAALLANEAATPDSVIEVLDALLAADNAPGPVALVARPGLGSEAELADAGATPDDSAPTAWSLPGGDPGALAAVREGRAAVQDVASQLVALALADAPVDGSDARWLDLCAGPGGKAGLLTALSRQRGASLLALEVSEHRAELVRHTLEAARGAGADVQVLVGDGRALGAERGAEFDRVLVDAPCTGLGALRRRPEARWRRRPEDLTTLGPLQRDLLSSAVDAVRAGGVVGYATCSPHLAETQLVVRDVLKARGDLELLDARSWLTDRQGEVLPGTGPGPWAQLWPHVHGTDAMFLALLRRTSGQ